MKANVFGFVSGNLGYNVHTRGFIEGLISNDVSVKTVPLETQPTTKISRMIMESVKKPFYNDAPSVCITYGDDMHKFVGKKRIGYTVWETTRVPKTWPASLEGLDALWTVSKHSRDALINSGVEKDVKIVPEGVDTTVFNNYVEPHQRDPDAFLFLAVMKWEMRKNPKILLEAFAEEFKPDEKVRLAVQMHNPFVRGFNIFQQMFALNLGKHAPIVVLPPVEETSELARYYKTADCFVFPTSGESWGLPPLEALACGVPVITTNWGGCLEYMKEDYGWLIDVEKMETPNDGMFFNPTNFDEGNEWAIPSKKHLRELMRYAFEHKDECKKKGGKNSYSYVNDNFTWEKSGEKAVELLKEVVE